MMINKMSDADLVTQYVKGSEHAFAILVKRHKAKILTTIFLIVKDRDHAEDLLQDTFCKVIRKLKAGEYSNEGKFLQWVCRIARNMAIDSFRKGKRNPHSDIDDVPRVFNSMDFSEESIESIKIKDDTHALLRKTILALPETQREVVMMRHYSDMSFQEIAEETGVSINTALGRMRYALINLRKQLQNESIAYDNNFYPE